MTKLEYAIMHNNTEVKRVPTMAEAEEIIAELGGRFKFKSIYTPFDPEDTPERREALRNHAKKVHASILKKKGMIGK